MTDAPVAYPTYLGAGAYECGLAPGVTCHPYAGSRRCRVVDSCTTACGLWQDRHNSSFDAFGAHLGYHPDTVPTQGARA